ncbi:hypothetical protein SUGI_0099520 [Cryptomeria japonica]|nr:hypothetical protein SUGI_0099520 [Cryptomeria japonica]
MHDSAVIWKHLWRRAVQVFPSGKSRISEHGKDISPSNRDRIWEMGALITAVIAIAAVIVGWVAIELACKPCLDKGREAIDASLDPTYDPDERLLPPTSTANA